MSKSKKKKNEEKGESLVDKCKSLLSKMAECGQDVDGAFARIGGKESFLQHIQDIEDDVADDYSEIFKKAYENEDVRRCIRSIVNIVEKDIIFDKRGLRKILYSEGNLLQNPLNYKFDESEYKKTQLIIASTVNRLNEISKCEENLISAENAKLYNDELTQLYHLYECLYTNRIENEKRLKESEFLQLSLPQIVQSFLVFFQSQLNLLRDEMSKRWKRQDYVTGFESEVASESVYMNPEVYVSFNDSLEHLLSAMDTLFRYVFFLKGKEEKTKTEILQTNFITPFKSSDYMMISTLVSFDETFSRMEALFRYSGWNIKLFKTQDGKIAYGFYPPDDKTYKTHVAAKLRKRNNIQIEIVKDFIKIQESTLKKKNVLFQGDGLKSEDLPGGFFSEYLDVSRRLDLNDVESFHFGNDYKLLESYAKPQIESTKRRNKPYYFTCKFNGMCVEEYLDAYVFIYTFSKVYYCAAVTRGSQKQLISLISLEYLYTEFSSVSGYDHEKAEKLIKCFVFDKEIAKKKKYGDVFARPLISVGSEMVLLSECLVEQINLDRNIEVLLEWNDVDLAPMGKDLERKMIEELKKVSTLSVNSETIEFLAYDDKNVEFDFIALLDDYIIVMEMKSVLQPYDDDELYRRHKPISEGIEQVVRRAKIIQKDWDKIKKMSNINLPDKPFDDDHIIKVVCSDIADFTGLEEKGVLLTDDATVIKYFTNPYVRGAKQTSNGVELIKQKHLWPEGRPTAKEFISYLRNPDTMGVYMQSIGSEWKPVPFFEGYKRMVFKSMVVKEDPQKKLAEKYNLC